MATHVSTHVPACCAGLPFQHQLWPPQSKTRTCWSAGGELCVAAGGREVGVLRWGGVITSVSLRLSQGTEATGRRTRLWGKNSPCHPSGMGKRVIIFEMEASCTGSNGERAEIEGGEQGEEAEKQRQILRWGAGQAVLQTSSVRHSSAIARTFILITSQRQLRSLVTNLTSSRHPLLATK